MKVAVIDSGIRADLLNHARVTEDLRVDVSGKVRPRLEHVPIVTAHATTCAQIMESYVKNIEFCSLQIFSDVSERATCRQFLSALEWCFKQEIPVVHMSIGTSNERDFKALRKVTDRMLRQGQILVAAHSNSKKVSYPAEFRGVFGVSASSKMEGFQFEEDFGRKGLNFVASSKHKIEIEPGCAIWTPVTNSFAAPTITAAVCRILQGMNERVNPRAVYSMLMNGKAEDIIYN